MFPVAAAQAANTVKPAATGYYHTSGNQILDSNGQPAVWNGLNWFGFETETFAPHGLWTRSLDTLLTQIRQQGYNLIRLPFSNEMFNPDAVVSGVDWNKNPDLKSFKPIQVLDRFIQKASRQGIQILLDRHRPDSKGQSELWYTSAYTEQRWISDWTMLAKRYKDNPAVIGADLHNEPNGQASWGSGVMATDWRLAAERAGNAILAVNPRWLIVVEGVEKNVKGQPGAYWWGGNLKGVAKFPVRLKVANRLVYSAHDYGPGVYNQQWFASPQFPGNMKAIWDSHWGYISKKKLAPVLVGEFGGRSVSNTTVEGKWQRALIAYIAANQLYWAYWTLNPNGGDTGGLLLDDWVTWHKDKQSALKPIMAAIPAPNTQKPMK